MPARKPKTKTWKPTRAQKEALLKMGRGRVRIVVNRLPMDLVRKIKSTPPPLAGYLVTYGGKRGQESITFHYDALPHTITRYVSAPIRGNVTNISVQHFSAKTGKRLTSAQVMDRMKRKGIASLE